MRGGHNGNPFTTYDNDNDNNHGDNCASIFKGKLASSIVAICLNGMILKNISQKCKNSLCIKHIPVAEFCSKQIKRA